MKSGHPKFRVRIRYDVDGYIILPNAEYVAGGEKHIDNVRLGPVADLFPTPTSFSSLAPRQYFAPRPESMRSLLTTLFVLTITASSAPSPHTNSHSHSCKDSIGQCSDIGTSKCCGSKGFITCTVIGNLFTPCPDGTVCVEPDDGPIFCDFKPKKGKNPKKAAE